MTPEQHAQHIRQLEFKLYKADYGMGMPRDYQRVLELRTMLEAARKEAAADAEGGGLSQFAIRVLGFDVPCRCGHEKGLHDTNDKFCQAFACECECFEQAKEQS
jgi:hypothetical protein